MLPRYSMDATAECNMELAPDATANTSTIVGPEIVKQMSWSSQRQCISGMLRVQDSTINYFTASQTTVAPQSSPRSRPVLHNVAFLNMASLLR